MKSKKKIEINKREIKQSLGREPLAIEWEVIQYFYKSRYIASPFPEFEKITSKSNVSFEIDDQTKLVIGSEGKKSVNRRSSKRTLAMFGIQPRLKYKTKLSTISFGITKRHHTKSKQLQGVEDIFFLQDNSKLDKLCSDLLDLEQVSVHEINPQLLGHALIALTKGISGVNLHFSSKEQMKMLSDKKVYGALIFSGTAMSKKVMNIFQKYGSKSVQLGTLKKTQFLTVNIRKKRKAHLPISVFNISDLPSSSLVPVIQKDLTNNRLTLPVEQKSYNKQLLNVWNKCKKKTGSVFIPVNKQNGSVALFSKIDSYAVSVPDNISFLEKDLKNGSSLMVSNASRQLACKGFKPVAGGIILHGTDLQENNEKWNIHALLSGATEACQSVGFPMTTPIITSGNVSTPTMELCIGGKRISKSDLNSFTCENNFISLIRSHRGELNNSIYSRDVLKQKSSLIPSVDLRMEGRLQETILQGIQTGLIHSAMNVSNGGLAIALVRLLVEIDSKLGARVHLSRKLRQDEMLFGETQGMVVVSIGERDLMEFERICMSIGIPSTTIGRVTNDGRFRFNDVINIDRKKL